MEILKLINRGSKRLKNKNVYSHKLDSEILLSKVLNITKLSKTWLVTFQLSRKYKKYIIEKGSVTINGVSLTIVKIFNNSFQISIIPHTLKHTNLFNLRINDKVNIEFDLLGKYIKNFFKK